MSVKFAQNSTANKVISVSFLRLLCSSVSFQSSSHSVHIIIMSSVQSSVSERAVARYDNYRLWRMHIETEVQLEVLKELEKRGMGIDFIGHVRKQDQKLTILVPSHLAANIEDLFRRYNISNTVLLPNIQDNIDRQRQDVKPKETKGSEMNWSHYYHWDTIMDYLHFVADKYDFVTMFEIGKSYEGRPIHCIKISKGSGSKTGVFIEGGIHAREWISPATVTYLINQLLTSSNADVQALAEDFDWYFCPVLNPDGFVYTLEVDRLWRKNRKPYGLCVGVDLNRNFDCHWSGSGSSSDPAQFDFAGSGPNSEPEVKALSDFLTSIRTSQKVETFISLHSFSQLIMFPYGHTAERVDNYDDMKAIGEKAREAIKARHGMEYETGSINEVIYPSAGGSSDWVRHGLNIPISFTFELRCASDGTDMFILPADQITPVGEEITDAFVAIFKEAKARGYFKK